MQVERLNGPERFEQRKGERTNMAQLELLAADSGVHHYATVVVHHYYTYYYCRKSTVHNVIWPIIGPVIVKGRVSRKWACTVCRLRKQRRV